MAALQNLKPKYINVIPATKLCYNDEYQATTHNSTYKTHSKNRGLVLIINNLVYLTLSYKTRDSHFDSENLKELFTQIGMQVDSRLNLSVEEMRKAIIDFKEDPRLGSADIAVVIIMGHGFQDNCSFGVDGIDGGHLKTIWVEEQFFHENCPILKNVPKIIMYNTCCEKMITAQPHYMTKLNVSDLLIISFTMKVSFKECNTKIGTLLINLLCKAIMDFAYKEDFRTLVNIASNEFYKTKFWKLLNYDTFSYISAGFKPCYLHPKIYMENDQIKNIHTDSPSITK